MSKRAGKKRTPEIEREQFEAYGEYTYGPACTETAQDARVF